MIAWKDTNIRRDAYAMGREMIWKAVAERYLDSFQHARADRKSAPRTAFAGWTLGSRAYALPPLRLDHIVHMSDATGTFQHALYTVPDFHHGYCTDDNARAFILCNLLDEAGSKPSGENLEGLATSYLAFLACALNRDSGRFRNFMSFGRQWLEEAGSEDSHGRALWALGTGAGRSRNEGRRRLCMELFSCSQTIRITGMTRRCSCVLRRPGNRSKSAIAAPPSRLRRAGWSSHTASAPCALTASVPPSWI